MLAGWNGLPTLLGWLGANGRPAGEAARNPATWYLHSHYQHNPTSPTNSVPLQVPRNRKKTRPSPHHDMPCLRCFRDLSHHVAPEVRSTNAQNNSRTVARPHARTHSTHYAQHQNTRAHTVSAVTPLHSVC